MPDLKACELAEGPKSAQRELRPNGAYSQLIHPASVWRCQRKVASVRTSHFHSALVKNAAGSGTSECVNIPRAPVQGCLHTQVLDTGPCSVKMESRGLGSEQSHLPLFTERPMKAKELYFCKHANDCSSTGMVRA